ncbi:MULTISPECIES: branched-chain amino acid ABC transporter permease [Rhodobacterales]|jgi:branched-chain amino acid transport system permease protein|uniref:High-affinity branched-chain amino acid transport system permease protein LivH n=6 Tax=Rhodobacterales TaxID=204455 RepID=A0A221KA80_9RHOB|nr:MULTISPECIES: branched-chain amino acid ABC transporter permease [Rhodobacterales]ASM75757.1 high-affinity branched-chain amino acid transport system permease protein LivH [Pseudosulfitobacter pseudonitzschiae]MCZ4258752.1 branched-chain amino acid ABC transporter permease [Sulfitobacter sp. G21635-S1]MDD9722243.1 branched-chain amino acid ABC transporter permease [Sulfitobacter sp. PR48]OAN70289.1 ABC transporter permease [Sulfitobacter sp. EhC04]OAN93030.1 ABC transporter permease [Sulfit|tara:strand:- start:309 stop:1166 length:858 start_codon:yes stop_codon:yes gene_type:complete
MSIIVIGLSLSFLLFLLAAGLTLIFGMLGVINFAHGALYMLGAFVGYQIVHMTGSFWLGLLFAPLIVACVGALIEILALKQVYDRDHIFQLLLTFGFILVIDDATKMIWGFDYKQVPTPEIFMAPISMFGSQIPSYRLFVIGFGAAVSLALFLLLDRSKWGMIIRAASSDPEMAQTLGVNVNRVRTGVFALGAYLAALGGVVSAPLVPIELGMGFSVIIDCFVVVIIGGLGNIRGAILASLLLGMTRAAGYTYATEWVELLTFALLIGTLMFRPAGLFSTKGRSA